MAGLGPEDLDLLCHDFLDACVEALDTIPIFAPGLGGAPERSYVSPGQSADDCCPDQLTVWWENITETPTTSGSPTGQSAKTSRGNNVLLIARIVRCMNRPEAGAPSTTTEEDYAVQKSADAWALWNHIYNMVRAGTFSSLCDEVYWDGLRSITPSGGCSGSQLVIRVALDGYEETL